MRLGGTRTITVNVRLIAATNTELKEAVAKGQFREDLYYRLAIFPIKLPPLRERRGDVVQLAESFLEKFCPGVSLSAEAIQTLAQHDWPGNVRELKNVIERSSIVVGGGREILARHILF